MCQIWCTACAFCPSSTFCHYVVTKCTERSTHCTFCHPFASNTKFGLSLPSMCVCVCAHVCVCVCVFWCAFVCGSACVLWCIVFYYPASISAELKFCIALWAVWNMTIDMETEWKCGLIVLCWSFLYSAILHSRALTVPTCDSSWVNSFL